jgi:hypothetical protein
LSQKNKNNPLPLQISTFGLIKGGKKKMGKNGKEFLAHDATWMNLKIRHVK